MKERQKRLFLFKCDYCYDTLGVSENEEEARKSASSHIKNLGGQWEHPNWGIKCSKCI